MSIWPQIRSLLLPVTVTILVPAGILAVWPAGSAWDGLPFGLAVVLIGSGGLLVALGLGLVAWTITLFHRIGKGTLAHWPPTQNLVFHGPYQHVRNPMLSGVFAILIGEVLALRSTALLIYTVLYIVFIALVIRLGEEPNLARRFGTEYDRYRQHVRAWIPRLRPWTPPSR